MADLLLRRFIQRDVSASGVTMSLCGMVTPATKGFGPYDTLPSR